MSVELLAPAGDYECFLAAINNGADAVYLAGPKFGARAYAKNFSYEKIAEAIEYAHLFGKKIYLTVNTLVKESEIGDLQGELKPLAKAGVDAFIVQDIGAADVLKNAYPDIELHASTQMTVSGVEGIKVLERLGFSRVILPRELSVEDILHISKNTDMDLEVFVHGAMCYSVSGQCLFSSCLGDRSANRGRCAGPCRLPYSFDKKEGERYLLSLKDLVAVETLPLLIDAGVKSFKIEGRMKPEGYVSAITGVYRKYIDKYLHDTKTYTIDSVDKKILEQIYHRGDLRDGYFTKPAGSKMVTLDSPTYQKAEEKVELAAIERYNASNKKIPVDMYLFCKVGEPISLFVSHDKYQVNLTGDIVGEALNSPLDYNSIKKQMAKLGESPFMLDGFNVEIEGNGFLPVSSLNKLRREGMELLRHEILNRI